jgi:3-dehydroquinate synthase
LEATVEDQNAVAGRWLGYPYCSAIGAWSEVPAVLPAARDGLVIVSDERVWSLWGAVLLEHLRDLPDRLGCYALPVGEQHKTRETKARLEDRLLADRWGREVVILALGGGVVTDLAGFVAATYLRGVSWVALPTTLLGMVDASVGGKTAVNTPAGKNLVGAFHRPSAVVADLRALDTLPESELGNGLAEMVKHGAVADRAFLDELERSAGAVRAREPASLAPLVARAAAIKAEIVARDEREHGVRAVLNFGHTVAHALERSSGFELHHGLAVAIGMAVEATAAVRVGRYPREDRDRLVALLRHLGLPVRPPPRLSLQAVREAFAVDKKNRRGEVRFALPSGPDPVAAGAEHTVALDLQVVMDVLEEPGA